MVAIIRISIVERKVTDLHGARDHKRGCPLFAGPCKARLAADDDADGSVLGTHLALWRLPLRLSNSQ